MILRQLFDSTSKMPYAYLLASRHGGEALIIDQTVRQALSPGWCASST